jgi:hypothetical protein
MKTAIFKWGVLEARQMVTGEKVMVGLIGLMGGLIGFLLMTVLMIHDISSFKRPADCVVFESASNEMVVLVCGKK